MDSPDGMGCKCETRKGVGTMKNTEEMPSSANFHKIRSLEVVGGFLDGMQLEFGESLNCLIGGRGTGKTSVVELVRWTLAHMPDETEENARSEERRVGKECR